MSVDQFNDSGFIVTSPILDHAALAKLERDLAALQIDGAGARDLLDFPWCIALAQLILAHPHIRPFLSTDSVAVQCTYFEKSKEQNWLVPVHQDLSIPVREKMDHAELSGWSEKDGAIFVQAPQSVLQKIIAVRLYMDDCGVEDGPLRVVPGSHRLGRLTNEQALIERDRLRETVCTVERAGTLVMKPLILHASSKASGSSKRRVLHFVYGPRELPYGLNWRYAVEGEHSCFSTS
jgi:ectoine hydroxylase-related dioxygenase (phytanoyl-CoA dioxygenase family)